MIAADPAPGSGLLMPQLWAAMEGRPSSALEAGARYTSALAGWGLDPAHLRAPLWAGTAVPLVDASRCRFEALDPAQAGHPLLWLPPGSVVRYTLVDEDGAETTEDDELWMCRVLLEAVDAGWWDPEDGWLDVTEGIDPARLEAWFAGGADAELDALCAPEPMEGDWSIQLAQELLPHLQAAAWVLAGEEVLGRLEGGDTSGAVAVGRTLGGVDGVQADAQVWEALSASPADATALRAARELASRYVEEGTSSLEQVAAALLGPGRIA